MTALIIAIIGSNGLWTMIMYLVKRHGQKDPATRLLLGIAHDRLHYLCEKALERGYTSEGEMDDIVQIYDPYTALGGNGTGKQIYERYIKLPIRRQEE